MTLSSGPASGPVADVIGIGFGPANLGFAIALAEANAAAERQISAVYVEAKPWFDWHPGMMLPGATMQIAFPKDLATMRNPRSEFTFFNYLHDQGRMVDFINHQTFFPSRREFGDYLAWAAGRVPADVRYGVRATAIRFDGELVIVECDGPDGVFELRGRNLLFAPGLTAVLPPQTRVSDRVFHNHQLLELLPRVPSAPNGAFAVLGAGQSAAEVAAYLHDQYPAAEIHVIHGKFGMTPADDSPFANRVFDPQTIDGWHAASPEVRERMMGYHRSTNYSAVDIDLLEELYRREYQEKVSGARRLRFHRASEIESLAEEPDGVRLVVRDLMTGQAERLDVDALVCATGFRPNDIRDLLGGAAECFRFDENGPVVGRNYRLEAVGDIRPGVYLNGGVEATHGLSSSLLSCIAVRAGEILESVQHSGMTVAQ